MALVFGLEAATMIENEVDRLDILYGFGVRQIGIAYSEANSLGSGLKERRDGGLTYFGERAVARMNKLGLAIDISHSGDVTSHGRHQALEEAGLHDALRIPRGVADQPDEARRGDQGHGRARRRHRPGGGPAHHACPRRTRALPGVGDGPLHPPRRRRRHRARAFGPDTLFGDHVGLHDAFSSNLSIGQAHGHVEYEKQPYVDGLENPAECFYNIIGWLVCARLLRHEISAVVGGNIVRVLEEVWV